MHKLVKANIDERRPAKQKKIWIFFNSSNNEIPLFGSEEEWFRRVKKIWENFSEKLLLNAFIDPTKKMLKQRQQ